MKTLMTLALLCGAAGIGCGSEIPNNACRAYDDATIASFVTLVEADQAAGLTESQVLQAAIGSCVVFDRPGFSVQECFTCLTAVVEAVY